jgi:hypothetical protein
MDARRADAVEHWHSMTLHGGMVASVVVVREAGERWTARTQLRDRSLTPRGDCRKSGPCATHEAALQAGQAAALRLYKAFVGLHKVPDPARTIVLMQPAGGYQSQAMRRFAGALTGAQTKPLPAAVPERGVEAEVFA